MTLVRPLKIGVRALAAAAVLATVSAPVASAEALSPWWGLTSGARPTTLSVDPGKDEVQKLTVSATTGDLLLANTEALTKGELLIAIVPYNAKAEEVQEALETKVYPSRKVLVTGGPGDEEGQRPYEIVFPHQSVQPIFAEGGELVEAFGGERLSCEGATGSGCTHEASLTELQEGAPTQDEIAVSAENRGDTGTTGKVTIADQLPPGIEAVAIEGAAGEPSKPELGPVECSIETLTCTFDGSLPPFEQIEVRISVVVGKGITGGVNSATVSGGSAPSAVSASHPTEVNGPGRFGFEDWQAVPENPSGSIDTQAGSHPFQVTFITTLNTQTPDSEGQPRTFGLPKDVIGELPPGFIGNPTPFAQCTDAQFEQFVTLPSGKVINSCPPESAIGVSTITFNEPYALHMDTLISPIFNMVPRVGEPARFGFLVAKTFPVFLDTSVRTGGDYGVNVTSSNITQISYLISSKLTVWGVPGDPRHDAQRGWVCLLKLGECPATSATSPPPFLAMPTSCGQPFDATLRGDSWSAEGKPSEQAEPITYTLPAKVDGCNHLPFDPSVIVTPDGTAASSPTGLNVDVHVPQTSVLNAEGLAESAVKDITVALPEGVAVNPAGGDGLQACSEGQVGFTGVEAGGMQRDLFSPTLPEPFCPNASKIGEVTIKTPLLPPGQFVKGFVYLATQNENPFGSLIALYIVARDPVSGVLVKLPGETHLTPSGQVIGTFKNNPQLAFEDAELHFFGGERAPLATPARCGPYTTNATFTPWSGNEAVSSTSTFSITSGPNGSPCPGASLPFSPSLTGGTTNINAGAFSPLTTTIGREDGQQNMQSVQLHMPPGLSGLLSGVKLCPEAQANEGTCGPESEIGETTVSAGVGSDPVSVKGGRVYITEKYAGAPFGLSIVNPVKAGPFDLEHDTSNPAQMPACDCVVVRARIEVDAHTAALTVTTDPSGPHAIPHLIDGIPVQIQKVNVTVNRPGFTFNPTNCNPMSLTGSIASDEGASSPVSVPFQATNCAVLAFKPDFKVSVTGKTSKAGGAGLSVKLAYPKAPFGSQANIAKVKVDLPRQLPSRLTTLQKACTAAQFAANPAGCPAASLVGHAKATTPLLPVPVEGPVYFVSHGGEAFPNLIMVLQGYGVTVDLVGDTFINKRGITSSTFKAIPDVPVGTFELTLPEGKYSALAALGSLCKSKLRMPTAFVAQNGAVIHKSTKIGVTGCSKHRVRHAKKTRRATKGRPHKKK